MAKKKLTDLTGDEKVTQADVLKGRGVFTKGGLLEDDREQYVLGGLSKLIASKLLKKNIDIPKNEIDLKKLKDDLKEIQQSTPDDSRADDINLLEEAIASLEENFSNKIRGGQDVGFDISRSQELAAEQLARKQLRKEGADEASPDILRTRMIKLLDEGKVKDSSEGIRKQKAEGGTTEDQMEMMLSRTEETPMEEQMTGVMRESEEQPTMLPDEEMEEDYVDYVVEKTLSAEDNQYLMSMLEQDDRLSVIFDQVVESATEFSGEGSVDGPGTETSDSIPARLSDGEFVITAKAVEEIGEDNLMSMMKNAESAADERQMAYEGGKIEEENVEMPVKAAQQQNIRVSRPTVSARASRQEQKDLVGDEIKKRMMLDPNQKHVRS